MEVHHHPHVEKKSFKEYLLEGLMIFLAVTMGFIAENIREHFVNKEKERQYISSFYSDLVNDELQLPKAISGIDAQQIQAADSIVLLLSNANTSNPANSIYYFLRKIIRQGKSNEWQLRSIADTIIEVVREEKDVLVSKTNES